MKPKRVITFYSSKGGVGRTMALANVGWLAASWGRRVLCVDWDLEAPGLDHYLGLHDVRRQTEGLVEAVAAAVAGAPSAWRSRLVGTPVPGGGSLDLLHAGRADSGYLERMRALRWDSLYADHDFGATLETWRAEWLQDYDLVLVDSRTGVTDSGSICAAQLPDVLVVFVPPNEQSLGGTLDLVRSAREARDAMVYDRGPLHVVPVVSRLENRVEYARSQEWWTELVDRLGPLTDTWRNVASGTRDILAALRVPYVPYWSFGEELAVEGKGAGDSDDVGYAYASLAALLLHRLADSQELLLRREQYLAQAGAPDPRSFPEDIHILHASRDAGLALAVAAELQKGGRKVSAGPDAANSVQPWTGRARHLVALVDTEPPSTRLLADLEIARSLVEGDPFRRLLEITPAPAGGPAAIAAVILRGLDSGAGGEVGDDGEVAEAIRSFGAALDRDSAGLGEFGAKVALLPDELAPFLDELEVALALVLPRHRNVLASLRRLVRLGQLPTLGLDGDLPRAWGGSAASYARLRKTLEASPDWTRGQRRKRRRVVALLDALVDVTEDIARELPDPAG